MKVKKNDLVIKKQNGLMCHKKMCHIFKKKHFSVFLE